MFTVVLESLMNPSYNTFCILKILGESIKLPENLLTDNFSLAVGVKKFIEYRNDWLEDTYFQGTNILRYSNFMTALVPNR